jgi:glucose-6-phosphate isomerase
MVVLLYKDQLERFSKYLQQLVMESLGKKIDLNGKIVNQGITVPGNSGATVQHLYIQQLRDGLNDFFSTFIEVLNDGSSSNLADEPKITSGDFLESLFFGTRQVLDEAIRKSITITIREFSAFSIGLLISLFERAVGIYTLLVNINAYHQTGVEVGKKAAANIIQLQLNILAFLSKHQQTSKIIEIAKGIVADEEIQTIFKICEHLSSNSKKTDGNNSFNAEYALQ